MNTIDITLIVNAAIALIGAGVSVFSDPVAQEPDHRGTAQGADRVGKDRRRCC
jgi:hypothetical protein